MTTECVYIPFNRKLYNDIVRFSDGRLDPATLAEEQILGLIEANLDDLAYDWFGERLIDFVRAHFPHQVKHFEERLNETSSAENVSAPLIWKQVIIQAGSQVRMQYAGTSYFGRVKDGKIEDGDGRYSPSEWARKVANDTSRNAWRDLYFKRPLDKTWVSAEVLRAKALAQLPELDI